MRSARTAAGAVEEGVLPPTLSENAGEILNVMASLFNAEGAPHVRLDALYEPRTWQISPTLADRWINLWGSPPPKEFIEPGLPFLTPDEARAGGAKSAA